MMGRQTFENKEDMVRCRPLKFKNESNLVTAYYDEAAADTHEYDGNGRRMRSKLNSAANWTHFVHDELTEQVLCEFTLVSSTFTLKAANTYGWGLISSNRETVKRYFHFDGLGNTVALTDSSETTQDTYAYTAFGLPLSSSGSSVNPFRYVGQWGYYDDGAMGSPHDFVLCGVRYYAPRYGRFLTWDPEDALNRYDYAYSSPTMAIDPDGRFIQIIAIIVIGVICIGCKGGPKPGTKPKGKPKCKLGRPDEKTSCGLMCDTYARGDEKVFPPEILPTARADCLDCCIQMFKTSKAIMACQIAYCNDPRPGHMPCDCEYSQ